MGERNSVTLLRAAHEAKVAAQDAEILRLRGALEPFARIAEYLDSKHRPADDADELHVWETIRGRYPITAGDFRRARAALSSPAPQDDVIVPRELNSAQLHRVAERWGMDYHHAALMYEAMLAALGAPTRG